MDRLGKLPDLDSLRCFVEAARLLNFRAAGFQRKAEPLR